MNIDDYHITRKNGSDPMVLPPGTMTFEEYAKEARREAEGLGIFLHTKKLDGTNVKDTIKKEYP